MTLELDFQSVSTLLDILGLHKVSTPQMLDSLNIRRLQTNSLKRKPYRDIFFSDGALSLDTVMALPDSIAVESVPLTMPLSLYGTGMGMG